MHMGMVEAAMAVMREEERRPRDGVHRRRDDIIIHKRHRDI
jgi:hypothetical protein